jgi:hypothetical protein
MYVSSAICDGVDIMLLLALAFFLPSCLLDHAPLYISISLYLYLYLSYLAMAWYIGTLARHPRYLGSEHLDNETGYLGPIAGADF